MSRIAEMCETSEPTRTTRTSGTSEKWGTGGKAVIAVWPDGGKWIVSRDRIDERDEALATHTLDVRDTEGEALAEGRREALGRELPLRAWSEETRGYVEG